MKMIQIILLSMATLAVASATTTFNFNVPSGTLGNSQVYTVGGVSITAYGFNGSSSPTDLYGKNGGGDENGVGLAGETNSEINVGQGFIQLGLSGLVGPFTITIGSTTGSDAWKIIGSNMLGSATGTAILSGGDESPHTITTSAKYLTVEATAGNVLLDQFTATSSVPEPGAISLVASGLALIGMSRLKRKKA